MTHITTKTNDKIDIVSVGLKGLLIFTFLFIYGLLLLLNSEPHYLCQIRQRIYGFVRSLL